MSENNSTENEQAVTVTVDGQAMTFNRNSWKDADLDLHAEHPLHYKMGRYGINNKHDIGEQFEYEYKRQFDSGEVETELKRTEWVWEEMMHDAMFTRKEGLERWPYERWAHTKTMAELKTLFVETFAEDYAEEIDEYRRNRSLRYEYEEDKKNRQMLETRIKQFWAFQSSIKRTSSFCSSMNDKVVKLIGEGDFETLCKEIYVDYEDRDIASQMDERDTNNYIAAKKYANDWLKGFKDLNTEMRKLRRALNCPERDYDFDADIQVRALSIDDLVAFDYQGFLTYLLDMERRFGDCAEDSITGPRFHAGDSWSSSVRSWSPFNMEANISKPSRAGDTWEDYLNYLLRRGVINKIKDDIGLAKLRKDILWHWSYERDSVQLIETIGYEREDSY